MSSRSLLAILITVLGTAVWLLVKETYVAVVVEQTIESAAAGLGMERSTMIAASGPFIASLAIVAVAVVVSYRLGESDRRKEPEPDIDPRVAFETIVTDRKWLKKNTETDAEKRQHLVSNYLNMRVDKQLHDALAQGQLIGWGSISFAQGEGPVDKIPATKWHEIEIMFDSDMGRRCCAKWRNKNGLAYLGIKLNAKQIAKCFSIKQSALR